MRILFFLFFFLPLSLFSGELKFLAEAAEIIHQQPSAQLHHYYGRIIWWTEEDSFVQWKIRSEKERVLDAFVSQANSGHSGSEYTLRSEKGTLYGEVVETDSWEDYQEIHLGRIKIPKGISYLTLKPKGKFLGKALMNTRGIILRGTEAEKVKILAPPFQAKSGFQQALKNSHPSMKIVDLSIPNLPMKISGIDFLSNGTMVIATWDAEGRVYLLSHYDKNPQKMRIRLFARGLAEPLGICVVKDRIYVAQKQELTELIDSNKDGICDEYRNVCNAWEVSDNFHEFAFGPVYKEGYFYMTLAIAVNPGGETTNPQKKDRGCVIQIDPRTGKYEIIAAGLRTPNGITYTQKGDLLVTDNQGDWLPASKLIHIKKNRFYGHIYSPPSPLSKQEKSPAIVLMPHNAIANSPTEPLEIPYGLFKKQILIGDIHNGGIRRVFYEKIEGEYQGAVFRFSQGLRGGINRLRWGPDGKLYAGITGNTGNWGIGKKEGLLRIEIAPRTIFEILALRAKSNGLEIEFTKPLKKGEGWSPSSYLVESWKYQPTKSYGGPKSDFKRHLPKKVSVSKNRRKVFLEIPNWQKDRIFHLVLHKEMEDFTRNSLFSGEAWYTLNKIPKNQKGFTFRIPKGIQIKREEIAYREVKDSRGETLYQNLCQSCHSINGQNLVGPSFKNLLGKKQVIIQNQKKVVVVVDRAYLKRAILNPSAEYPEGYQPIMPQTLAEGLKEEEIEILLNFISSLSKKDPSFQTTP